MVTEVITLEAPIPLDRSHPPIELLTPAEMAEADRLAGRTIASAVLMERAGQAVAEVASELLRSSRRSPGSSATSVLVLCGPGNNGGDGYVAARLLADDGCHVTVATLGGVEALKGDAAAAAARWTGAVIAWSDASIEGADLVIDAIFGAGLARAIAGTARTAIERVNLWARSSGRPVLAVDIPSGIDGSSGTASGTAIVATDTVTFFRLKPGHILMPGRLNCGTVHLADIGIGPEVLEEIKPKTRLNAPSLWAASYPVPRLAGHKYGRGHALVVSGPIAQHRQGRRASARVARCGRAPGSSPLRHPPMRWLSTPPPSPRS